MSVRLRREPSQGWSYLRDPDVKRWYENMARGSQKTADVAIRNLGLFCTSMKTSPKAMVYLKEKEVHDLLLDFIAGEEKRGQAGSSIATRLKHVKSWLVHNGVRIDRPIKVAGAMATPTLTDERTPTQDELQKVFLGATPNSRVACVLMAHAGLRPEVLGNYLGKDGLRVKDFPDLIIQGKEVLWTQTPAMVVVRPELSKAGHKYFSFLGEEGCRYVKDYLEERLRVGATLGPDSDLLHPRFEGKQFVRTTNVGDLVRNSLRAAGLKMRPYVLRAYFDTQLLLAESKGKVAHDYRVFWMGHKGSMEARYTTNKGRLPKDMIEDMRSAYQRCEPFLSTVPSKRDPSLDEGRVKLMLLIAGASQEEVDKLDISAMSDKELLEFAKEKMGKTSPGKEARSTQKAVSSSEVDKLLAGGWQYVASLGPDRVILQAPPGAGPEPKGDA
jgi:hypothetical protein